MKEERLISCKRIFLHVEPGGIAHNHTFPELLSAQTVSQTFESCCDKDSSIGFSGVSLNSPGVAPAKCVIRGSKNVHGELDKPDNSQRLTGRI